MKRQQILRVCALVSIALMLLLLYPPLLLQYFLSYARLISSMVYHDAQRHHDAKAISLQTEWKLHEMEMEFNKARCKSSHRTAGELSSYSWLTAMINDDYAIGAVHAAYMIDRLSCVRNRIALVSDGVSAPARAALTAAGYKVKVVEALDCNWMDRRVGRTATHSGIPGTHMRFHAWNYTQFTRIIYFDADLLLLGNIDELFDMDVELAASYCARPGIIDPCFNAGLLVFRPSERSSREIFQLWSQLSKSSSCPNDQVLLWHYYADRGRWTPLPYAYNVRRHLYHPMKVYHFACCLTPKPWRVNTAPSLEETHKLLGPLVDPWQMVTLWWKYFYRALDEFQLTDWYSSLRKT